ncbi:MAG: protein-disulfide reductase DsbD family protein [Bacteroidota bacterium]|jgi:thiol:disulfide interchange protein DsbD
MKTKGLLLALLSMLFICANGQEPVAPIKWEGKSIRIAPNQFQIELRAINPGAWDLYAPDINFEGIPSAAIVLPDSSVKIISPLQASTPGNLKKSKVFEGSSFEVYNKDISWKATIEFTGVVPASFPLQLNYTYGREDEFFPGESASIEIAFEGGKAVAQSLKIEQLDIQKPFVNCGPANNESKEESGLLKIFLLGFLGGLFALLTPCVFPMVPLTVSFFTKHGNNKQKGRRLAIMYGFFIFLIYISFSIPFHLAGNINPSVYNDISTNVYLNTAFFIIFLVFAFSFFGFYEITLPGGLANSANAKQGSDALGVFFMALTLTIVSFSCTGPILGTLLVGTATSGAWPLTAGLAGFGVALGLPFALFALFPQWLNSLPKSGGWLNTVKVVLGFIELALALKFISNADLVAHWSIIKREIFFGIWILIFLSLFIYLMGWIKFPHDTKGEKISMGRRIVAFAVLGFTLYLIPGVTNTKYANISLISGFPPPVCYSIFTDPVNCDEPLKDYQEALKLAKEKNKPILIDFTGWACVNCRKMEENVWTKKEVKALMDQYILVSLYVDDKEVLPIDQQQNYKSSNGTSIQVKTVGNKWSLFQTENFNATSQPWYVAISPDEQLITSPIGYTPNASDFEAWLTCGLNGMKNIRQQQQVPQP